LDNKNNARSESALVERCRGGDREAQRTLFEQTYDRIHRLLLRMTGNSDDAADLMQETYLKGFAQIARFDGRSSVGTWLYKIAVNEALQFFRRAKSLRVKLGDVAQEHRNGAYTSDATEIRLDVRSALAMMDPSDRAILLLRHQEGQDYRTIAEVMGCAEGTVASRLSRSRERLRGMLQESYGSSEESGAPAHPKGSP